MNFKLLPESENGDGIAMQTTDGNAYVSVSGMWNVMDTSLMDEYRGDVQFNPNPEYKFLGENFYVISYKEDNKIVFKRVEYDKKENLYVTAYFKYSSKYKEFMNPIIERITSSLLTPSEKLVLNDVNNDLVDNFNDLEILEDVYKEVILNNNSDYLLGFCKDDLSIIRNTIYARRGYIFKSERFRTYFSTKDWYKGTTTNSNILPKDEERLANIIKKYEK
ncbi:MAG: YARHG domain-containing protein [Fusobacterium sp.]|nr:YARHG domain-containing protein [Fusobacterium sp.]